MSNQPPRMKELDRWLLYKHVGARLRKYRMARNEPLVVTAGNIGTATSTLQRIENGETPPPLHLVVTAMKYFGIQPNDLIPLDYDR